MAEYTMDFCQYSIFLTSEQKETLNLQLNYLFFEIRQVLEQLNFPLNLYLSGSLSRKEPSVCLSSENMILYSDIDLIAATTKEFIQKLQDLNIELLLKNKFSDYNISIFVTTVENLPGLGSLFGRDFYLSHSNSLYETLPTPTIPYYPPNKIDQLENFVHQMCGFFFHPDFLQTENSHIIYVRDDLNYLYLKMLLECLRVQLDEENDTSVGYYNIYVHKQSKKILNIICEEDVCNLIHDRELFIPDAFYQYDTFSIIKKSIYGYFECKNSKDFKNIIISILNGKKHTLYEIFQFAILTFIVMLESPEQDDFFKLFQELICLVKDCVQEKSAVNTIIQMKLKDTIKLGNSVYQKIMNALIPIRQEYIKKVYVKNIGQQPLLF